MKRNELYHHGVKGQKWGVIRYQNSDGTLNAKGRKHAASSYKKILNTTDKQIAWKKRDASDADNIVTGINNKETRLAKKGKTLSLKDQGKREVAQQKYDAAVKDIESARKFTNSVIANAANDNYQTFASPTSRNVTRGYEYALNASAIVLAGAAGAPFVRTMHKTTSGYKYKVR